MEFQYKNKKYDVLKVKGQWRVYSTDPSFTKEEGMEVLKALEDTEKKATTTNKEKEKNMEEEKDIIKIVNEIFRNESEHNRRLMIGEEEADRSEEYIKNLMKGYDRGEHKD
ncbi:MAG: hypothetical protein IKS41_05930 [Alphaproteobacteria bacterium]|nr:hypothetical protein [Alphaproteobacteria bacterium]